MKTFFDNDNFTGVIPTFDGLPGPGLLQGIINFEPVGWCLPWAWIATVLVVALIMGIVMYQFNKTWDEWGGWEGVRKNYGLWGLLAFGLLLGYVFIYWLVFAPFASFSVIRDLQVDYGNKTMQFRNQNFFRYEIPFSQISHLAYIRKENPERTGLRIVVDHKYDHAILRWSEDPLKEEEFLKWAEGLADSWGTTLVPYHDRERFFQSKKFRDHIQGMGIVETKISGGGEANNEKNSVTTPGIQTEDMIRWTIPTVEREIDETDWNMLFGAIFVMLLFSPFYLVFIGGLSLVPTFIRSYITKKEPEEDDIFKIVFKSRIFYVGFFLMIAFFVSIFNSIKYVRSAEKVTIELSESRLFYSVENAKEDTFSRENLSGFGFWLDVFLGNPFTIWDRLVDFSKSNEIRQELYFSQVNRVRSPGQKIIFSQREEGKKEDNFETFTFDFSGLDPLVYQYMNHRIREVSGME